MKNTHLDRRRTQHSGVLSNGMWSAHGREEWRPVGRYEGKYEVSSLGRVRVTTTGHVKTQRENRGHFRSTFYWDGGRRVVWVHQLVAEAFVGPRPEGTEVRHLDGNGLNNIPSNLAYGTHSENMVDRRGHGTAVNAHTNQVACKRPRIHPREHSSPPHRQARVHQVQVAPREVAGARGVGLRKQVPYRVKIGRSLAGATTPHLPATTTTGECNG